MSDPGCFSACLEAEDANSADDALLGKLHYLLDQCFPLKTVRLHNDEKPWIKRSLKALINARDRAYKERKHLKYLRLREAAAQHAALLRRRYLAQSTEKGPASTWAAVNRLTGRQKSRGAVTDGSRLVGLLTCLLTLLCLSLPPGPKAGYFLVCLLCSGIC